LALNEIKLKTNSRAKREREREREREFSKLVIGFKSMEFVLNHFKLFNLPKKLISLDNLEKLFRLHMNLLYST
jgi:hypothetical protein